MASLAQATDECKPTAFHRLMKRLDEQGTLVRAYTQNIDGLEHKAGLSTYHRTRPEEVLKPFKCIPLHGSIRYLYCPSCQAVEEEEIYEGELMQGIFPHCRTCWRTQEERRDAGKRVQGIPLLIPDVVLYGQEHPDGEQIGEFEQQDLSEKQIIDLLLVVGTGMDVIGTRKMIRSFAQRVRRNRTNSNHGPCVIYLNFNFKKQKNWESTFDTWIQADCQLVASTLLQELDREQVKTHGLGGKVELIYFEK